MNVFIASVIAKFGKQLSSLFSWAREVLGDPTSDLGSYVRVSGMFVIVNTTAMLWYSLVKQKDILPLAQTVLLALIAAVLGNYIANKYVKGAKKPQKQPEATEPTPQNVTLQDGEK